MGRSSGICAGNRERRRIVWAATGSRRFLLLLLPLLAHVAPPLSGQDLPATFGPPDPDPDFLFDRPNVSIGLRGGLFLHGAGSDLFDFTEERFTIDRCNLLIVDPCAYRGPALGIEGAIWLGSRTEIMLGLDGSWVSIDSEYRDYTEDDGSVAGLPIRQTTRLYQGPALSIGARYFLKDRGQQVGRFVWVPTRWNVFVAGGIATSGHELTLEGDFIQEYAYDWDRGFDVPCLEHPEGCLITTEEFFSEGHVVAPFLGGGVEIRLTPHTAFTLEGRYNWGSHRLGRDFATDFVEPLDLSGARLTIGINYAN